MIDPQPGDYVVVYIANNSPVRIAEVLCSAGVLAYVKVRFCDTGETGEVCIFETRKPTALELLAGQV